VTKSVAAWTVVVGNPARYVKDRMRPASTASAGMARKDSPSERRQNAA
jgi:serine acetyltransferase